MMNLTPRVNRVETNILIDGGMEIWPEGASRSVANNTQAYGAVLFQTINTSSGVTFTNSQQTSIPANTNLAFSNQVSKTAAGTLAAGTGTYLRYSVEGYDLRSLMNDDFSVIFWVKSSVASNRSFTVQNGTSTHSFVQQYNISTPNAWELKVLKIPGLNSCPGTLNKTNGVGLLMFWGIVVGTNRQTASLNQWLSGTFDAGIGEDTTWLTGTVHDFSIAGAMILPGDWTGLTAPLYRMVRAGKNFQEELAMTQRYFEKTYDHETAPGTVTFTGAISANHPGGVSVEGNYFYRVSKRANASVTFYSPQTGASGVFRDSTNGVDRSTTQLRTGPNNIAFSTSGVPAGAPDISGHVVADARF